MPSATGIPAVSVVLPTYNRAHLLPRAIQSVLDQTYTDFELLVVDDGSTDETPAVMGSFTDDRIRYIRYEPNRGANAARNVGIRAARAPYIAFQDSDDDWFPEKLERCMAVWEEAGPEVGVVYSGYWKYMDAEGNRMFIPFDWVKQRDGWIHDELLRNNFVTTQAAVVRRECFDRSGYWLEGLPGKQEWELFLRISRDYQFRYIDEPLLNSRFTEGGISNNRMGIYRSMERILEIHHDDFAKKPAILAEHYIRLGLQFGLSGEFEKGREYLRRGAALQPGNWKYRLVALVSSLGRGAFSRIMRLYLPRDAGPL